MLQSDCYSSKVDMWAMGAIMAELFTLRPLFPGTNEGNQIYRICSVFGTPTIDSWPDGIHLARTLNYQFPSFHGVQLSVLIPSASEEAIDLISMLCSWNPCNRPTAEEALKHPFFRNGHYIPPCLHFTAAANRENHSDGSIEELEQKRDMGNCGALYDSSLNYNFPSSNELDTSSSTVASSIGFDSKLDRSYMQFVKQLQSVPMKAGKHLNMSSVEAEAHAEIGLDMSKTTTTTTIQHSQQM
ncbi:hypothetical protein D5086_028701 [Populus alba]|uniref:Uncharacterized protein n=1 Tax=Populus alba TaxID=43335 RepID=A0ACC4ARL1_POPAL